MDNTADDRSTTTRDAAMAEIAREAGQYQRQLLSAGIPNEHAANLAAHYAQQRMEGWLTVPVSERAIAQLASAVADAAIQRLLLAQRAATTPA